MTNRDCALLAFKLLGLWLIASAAIGVASCPYLWHTSPPEVRSWTSLFMLLPSLVSVGVGVPVWLSADWFADRVFTGTNASSGGSVRGDVLFGVALSVVGLFLVAEAIPALASSVFLWVDSRRSGILGLDIERANEIWSPSAKATAVGTTVRLLIGVAFVAGPGRLSAAAARIRKEFGGSLVEEPADDEPKRE